MRLAANGLQIEVDAQGPANGDPLLLIMGLGMQLTAWPAALVDALVAQGYRVIRLDNRDAGLSEGFDHLGVPSLALNLLRYAMRRPLRTPYHLQDMADDAVGVLDALGIGAAHVCGASMGGMIAQRVAATQPKRVKSLALIMTSSGARGLPQARSDVRRAMMKRPDASRPEAVVAHLERLLKLIGSPAFPPDAEVFRERLKASVARAWRPQGTARQLTAVVADDDRSALLGRIQAPTLVLHGRADPLIPVHAANDLAAKINGARLDIVDGMGHDLPEALLPRIVDAIHANAGRMGTG